MDDEVNIKEWVKGVILSCTNTIQMDYCQNLIDLYRAKEDDESDYVELQDTYNQHYNKIHGIIKR